MESTSCNEKMKNWFKKYFLQGQFVDDKLQAKMDNLPEKPSLYQLITIKYRKYLAVFIPLALVQSIWWSTAIHYNFFRWYPEYWVMPVVMILGSFVSGMTSEGSGAVAFPVMTLALHLDPDIARDFSLMIQSIGTTSALVCTVLMRVSFEWRAVIFGCIGAFPGFIIGVHYIDPLFTGEEKKMLFVSIWTAFAFALAILNSQKKRKTLDEIHDFSLWKALVLIFVGVIGGIFDAFAGSGIDICIFSVTTILFRVSEKIVTPTTVILKGIVSVYGFYYRSVMMGDIDDVAWKYFACSIPVSSAAAPIGSFLGSHLHRQVVAFFVYILEAVALAGFLASKPPFTLIWIGALIMAGGFVFFLVLSKAGKMLLDRIEEEEEEEEKNEKLPL